jgi:ABC-type microcin C transport system permease subunit YejE
MNTTQDKLIALGIVIVGPFVVTASIEFLPWWLSAPIVLLTAIFWLGTMKQIGEYSSGKKEG